MKDVLDKTREELQDSFISESTRQKVEKAKGKRYYFYFGEVLRSVYKDIQSIPKGKLTLKLLTDFTEFLQKEVYVIKSIHKYGSDVEYEDWNEEYHDLPYFHKIFKMELIDRMNEITFDEYAMYTKSDHISEWWLSEPLLKKIKKPITFSDIIKHQDILLDRAIVSALVYKLDRTTVSEYFLKGIFDGEMGMSVDGDNTSKLFRARKTLESLILTQNRQFNNQTDDFKSGFRGRSEPCIAQFLQEGGESLFTSTLAISEEMPNEVKTFLGQYKYLEKRTRPVLFERDKASKNIANHNIQEMDNQREKTLVFYYRFNSTKTVNEWQGADIIQSSMMVQDLVRAVKQNLFANFGKIVITPRIDDDFPYFLENVLREEFGNKFTERHFDFDNDFHGLENNENAYFIELSDGTLQPGLGISGIINARKKGYDQKVPVPIFWPDKIASPRFIELSKTGRTNISGINQPNSLLETREILLSAALRLDKAITNNSKK